MKLVVTEKNDAARQIANLLADGKPQQDKVYQTPVFRFKHDGEDWVTIGLRGHILEVDFPRQLEYTKGRGWVGITEDGETIAAEIPDGLEKPPFATKRKPFTSKGVELTQWKIPSLPYLVYAPLLKIPKEKEIIRSLKNLAAKSDSIVIATDFDREGELIGSDAADLVREVAPGVPITRARYSAFTKPEITQAFSNLVELDLPLAMAGESRQFIDLIWGATLTRFLTVVKRTGLSRTRSAGRVQTPTLALVVDRERERLAFVPVDFWTITGLFSKDGEGFSGSHAHKEGKNQRFLDQSEAQAAFEAVRNATTATVTGLDRRSHTSSAPIPFNTTELMRAAASIGITPARTMRIAESLYMRGLISYVRVDNTVYPSSLDLADTVRMLEGVPEFAPYARELLKRGKLTPTRGKKETTDHPPIYPTGVVDLSTLSSEDRRIYELVARRFLATLSDKALIEGTSVELDCEGEPFTVRGSVLVKPGWRAVYPYGLKKDEQLPQLEVGDIVSVEDMKIEQKQTEPPARYSQGSLIKAMEDNGLGTKSTRHSIIERLKEVGYILGDPVEPTAMGMAVIEALEKLAPHITTPDMTSQLEQGMDAIASGDVSQSTVVDQSREMLSQIVDELIPRKEELADAIADAANADARVGACPKCGGDLLVKSSAKTRSKFVGCSSWPDCDVTYPLPDGKLETVDEPCPVCGTPQIKVTPFRSKAQVRCLDPNCPSNAEKQIDLGPCPNCTSMGMDGRLMTQRSPRTLKRYIRCTNYESCSTSYPLPQNGTLTYEGEVCGHCGSPVVVITNRRGPWHTCVNMECPSKTDGGSDSKDDAEGGAGESAGTSKRTSSRGKGKVKGTATKGSK